LLAVAVVVRMVRDLPLLVVVAVQVDYDAQLQQRVVVVR
jgi:hypothetical protein